jgi:hypothetical protein
MDALAEEIDAGSSARQPAAVIEHVRAAHVPVQLLDVLPPLPSQLEYAVLGRTLNGSSGWIRTGNPPVNSVMQVVGLAGSSCR